MSATAPSKLPEQHRFEFRQPEFEIAWPSAWQEFHSSLRTCLSKNPVVEQGEGAVYSDVSAKWSRERISARALLASCAAHFAAVGLLLLPIWGFLLTPAEDLPPVDLHLTWYSESQDLPRISLPAAAVTMPNRAAQARGETPAKSAAALHPRQTILSEPLHITHPRQTLIQPDASAAPPAIEPQISNIVEWASSSPAKPQLKFFAPTSAPRLKHRASITVEAPEIAESASAPIPVTPFESSAPRMPLAASNAAPSVRTTTTSLSAAPEVSSNSEADPNLRRVIALSVAPAPPAPEVEIPNGNLAARIAISPRGAPSITTAGNSDVPGKTPVGSLGDDRVASGSNPVAITVSGGTNHSGSGGTAVVTGHGPAKPLNLRPMRSPSLNSELIDLTRKGPIDAAHLNPNLAPETLLLGKQIYTLHVNLPDLTSVSGSWTLHFAQLDEGEPLHTAKAPLSGPAPLRTVDPEYPPEIIKQHISGEVVLYAIVRKDGSVDSIQVVRSVDLQLDRNAVRALSLWKFRPGTRNGAPVDLEAVVHIPFEFRAPKD